MAGVGQSVDMPHGIQSAAVRAISVLLGLQVGLEYRFEHQYCCRFRDAIFYRGNSERSLTASGLVDHYPAYGLHALDELHLVCHYCDEALLFNTPARAPRFDFAAVASKVASALEHDHGVFDRVFLFNPYEARKVFQVYPVRIGEQASMRERAT